MKVLVLNCGSSSLKYQLFDMTDKSVLAKGLVDKIGLKGSNLVNKRNDGDTVKLEGEIVDHQAGIEYVLGVLVSEKHGSLKSLNEISAVGHRVVHGGETFKASALVTDEVIHEIESVISLAPLHNPPNLEGILAMRNLLPLVPQAAVFDTSFHQTMPDYAYMYAIPYSLYKKYGVRRYGFHGTSHRFVSKRACEILGVEMASQKIITCHLGNGASVAAIKNGVSVDTSMGLTPVEGLIMGTRAGDLDLGVLTFLMQKEEIGVAAANTLINKHSGVYGVSGVSSDMREVQGAAKEGNDRARMALQMYTYRLKKYIGAYAAAMGGLDVLVFTGGIGENSAQDRAEACRDLEFIGIDFDYELNEGKRGVELVISKPSSKVKVMIVPTNEELVIAEDTVELLQAVTA